MFLDSPLAVDVTEVFRNHPECFNEETLQFVNARRRSIRIQAADLRSRGDGIEKAERPAGAVRDHLAVGHVRSGRILHHLRNNIEDPRNTILITGFQAENTLGRKLVEKWPEVKIFGEPMRVRAEVKSLQALSAHADQRELLAWIKPLAGKVKKVFLVHGEPDGATALQAAIQQQFGVETVLPAWGQSFALE